MTNSIDTQKLAESIERVVEWDAGDYHELDNCYEAVSIIRQQSEVIRELREALRERQYGTSETTLNRTIKALALSAPLVKKEGE